MHPWLISPHHSDQMSQRLQVSADALCITYQYGVHQFWHGWVLETLACLNRGNAGWMFSEKERGVGMFSPIRIEVIDCEAVFYMLVHAA